MDRPVGVVGVEHLHDCGDIGPAGVHHEEVPGRRVVPGRQVGGHDDGLGPIDDQGLLVGVGVGGRRPDDLDPMCTQVLVGAGVGALLPLVQDDPDPHAALGRHRQVVLEPLLSPARWPPTRHSPSVKGSTERRHARPDRIQRDKPPDRTGFSETGPDSMRRGHQPSRGGPFWLTLHNVHYRHSSRTRFDPPSARLPVSLRSATTLQPADAWSVGPQCGLTDDFSAPC